MSFGRMRKTVERGKQVKRTMTETAMREKPGHRGREISEYISTFGQYLSPTD